MTSYLLMNIMTWELWPRVLEFEVFDLRLLQGNPTENCLIKVGRNV